MPLTDRVRSLARQEYAVLRSCIALLDQRVITPVGGERAGAAMGRLRHALDACAGQLFDRPQRDDSNHSDDSDHSDVRNHSDDSDHSDVRDHSAGRAGRAGRDEDDPPPSFDEQAPAAHSGSDVSDAHDESEDDESGAEVAEEISELTEEILEAEEGHLTGELADNDDLRRIQAELKAKHAVEESRDDGSAPGWPAASG